MAKNSPYDNNWGLPEGYDVYIEEGPKSTDAGTAVYTLEDGRYINAGDLDWLYFVHASGASGADPGYIDDIYMCYGENLKSPFLTGTMIIIK